MIYPDFGVKYIAFTQYYHSGHKAVDIPRHVTVDGKANPMANENLYFPHEMKLTVNSYAKDYGYFIRGEYKDGKDTWRFSSGHFDSKPNLTVGKVYKRGEFMSKCGRLGSGSTGYHNHFVVEKNGVRVNPLDVCYVYPDQVVGSKEHAKLKYYVPIKPVERDTSKDQLKTLKYLNVRTGAGTDFQSIGQANTGSIFNYYESKENGGYTWYRIDENQWIAQDKDNTYLEIMPAETKDYKELYEEELAKNEKLELEKKDLQSQLDQANNKLNQIKTIVN